MEKVRFRKWMLMAVILLLLGLVACSPAGEEISMDEPDTPEGAPQAPPDDPIVEDPIMEDPIMDEPAPEPDARLSGRVVNGVREIEIEASQFEFTPDSIIVNQNEEVRLILTTADVAHGIGLSQFGINATVNPGETTMIEFTADTVGVFTFFCTVPCGPGHGAMTGQLEVI
jgi:cytochrome c oxidase subunit II